jgi:hypothetical protein
MGLFGIFKRRSPIRDSAGLADFIDENAAFVAQKGIYEYARARAGHYAKVLFADEGFHRAVEIARWTAYPLGLAMVAEVVDNVLHSKTDAGRGSRLERLNDVVLEVFDRYPTPPEISKGDWNAFRAELDRRLKLVAMHAPKRAMDIPATYAKAYFDTMPIHEKLRARDFPTTHNYLKVVLCNVHEDVTNRLALGACAECARLAVV